ncbi:MAG: D-alanyl-D-alanine carboxypeptidase/D-alanyl-D-alanine-endopeptidase [Chitinophagaceae bacterium]
MKYIFCFTISLLSLTISAQTVSQKLQKAFQQFEADEQLKHAISSLYVIDAKTGQVVFDKNSQIGLAPASTQKIITSVTAFELLGKEYRYKTLLGYDGNIEKGILNGNLLFAGSGDPTLGSWRWNTTKDSFLFNSWYAALKKSGIGKINGSVWFAGHSYSNKVIPDGWIWQDIGNYYGAAAFPLNWRENQYEIRLRSGSKINDSITILSPDMGFINELRSASKGSGDNAYVYYDNVISGTIPVNESSFSIAAAEKDPVLSLCSGFSFFLNAKGIPAESRERFTPHTLSDGQEPGKDFRQISSIYSPSLDSIIYWLNKKSINLYAEALIKSFAYEKQGFGSTDSGVAIVKKFWKEKGLDDDELNICDGSGLSPLNRVTTHAQVEILKYAKTREWFPYFLNSLPEYNNMTMKSGTISDVKGFCGYHTARNGKEYIFSFLVNNYSGKTSSLVAGMYKVLDQLK